MCTSAPEPPLRLCTSAPVLHSLSTGIISPLTTICTSAPTLALLHLHIRAHQGTSAHLHLLHFCTTSAQPLHPTCLYHHLLPSTTSAPATSAPLHQQHQHLCTPTSAPPPLPLHLNHHLSTTFPPPLHDLCTTSLPPLHLFTCCTPALALAHVHKYLCTTSAPLHLLCSSASAQHQHPLCSTP